VAVFKKVSLFVVLISLCEIYADSASLPVPSAVPSLRYTTATNTIGKQQYRLTVSGLYATETGYVSGIDGKERINRISNNAVVTPGRAHLISAEGSVRYGIINCLDAVISLPFYSDITGWESTVSTLGDLYAGVLFVPSVFTKQSVVSAAGKLGVHLPTGNSEDLYFSRDVWYINTLKSTPTITNSVYYSNKVYFHPLIATSIDLQNTKRRVPLAFYLSAGGVVTDVKEAFTSELSCAVATSFKRMPRLSLEVHVQTRPFVGGRSLGDALLADPIRIVPSATFVLPGGTTLLFAAEAGLSSGAGVNRNNWYRGDVAYSTKTVPLYGASITASFNGSIRKRQGLAVVNTYDRDLDGVPDSIDVCRGTPEDIDGFEDGDGCPEYDNDKDGLVDETDGCPNNPEDKDGFEDNDGCPDFDNDSDGMPDSIDACPNSKGPENYRGCPDEEIVSFTRMVLSDIGFEEGTSKLTSGTETLDKIYSIMSKTPKMAVEFQVHTDNQGASTESSVLSQSRADVIRLYLVSKGIRPDKIKALGLGSEFPIADNSTASGRAKNQRVEVRRVD